MARPMIVTTLLAATLALTACAGDPGGGSAPTAPPAVATSGPVAPDDAADQDAGATSAPPSASAAPDSAQGTSDAPETAHAQESVAAQESAAASEDPAEAAAATTPPPPAETTEPAADPLPDGAVNVLLIGTDSRDPKSLTGMADTIMLLHLPADRSEVALISFTRDMWVPIPGLGEDKINAAFSRGGTDTLVATVSELLGGLDVDYALQANFTMFINLTRWLEGIEVDNQHASTVTVQSTGRELVFPEGRVSLTNTDALIYARQRYGLPLGDLDRTERQRAVMIGVLERLQERLSENPEDFPELVANLYGNVKVTGDVDAGDFAAMVPLLTELDPEDTISLMVPITGFGTVGGQSVNVVDREQTAALGEALREDSLEEYVERYGTGYAP